MSARLFDQYLFVLESYLSSGSAPLYHFTTLSALGKILATGKVASPDYARWDLRGPVPMKPDSETRISLTRDRNLQFQKNEVRLTFDSTELKNNYRLFPYADLMISAKDSHQYAVDGERREEAEEVVKRPIDINRVKPIIEISQKCFDALKKVIAQAKQRSQMYHLLLEEMSNPDFKFDADKHSHIFSLNSEKVKNQLSLNPNWQPKNMIKRIANGLASTDEVISNAELILRNVDGILN